jgi:hypothetical protein
VRSSENGQPHRSKVKQSPNDFGGMGSHSRLFLGNIAFQKITVVINGERGWLKVLNLLCQAELNSNNEKNNARLESYFL